MSACGPASLPAPLTGRGFDWNTSWSGTSWAGWVVKWVGLFSTWRMSELGTFLVWERGKSIEHDATGRYLIFVTNSYNSTITLIMKQVSSLVLLQQCLFIHQHIILTSYWFAFNNPSRIQVFAYSSHSDRSGQSVGVNASMRTCNVLMTCQSLTELLSLTSTARIECQQVCHM